jgi:hypothetical protein
LVTISTGRSLGPCVRLLASAPRLIDHECHVVATVLQDQEVVVTIDGWVDGHELHETIGRVTAKPDEGVLQHPKNITIPHALGPLVRAEYERGAVQWVTLGGRILGTFTDAPSDHTVAQRVPATIALTLFLPIPRLDPFFDMHYQICTVWIGRRHLTLRHALWIEAALPPPGLQW